MLALKLWQRCSIPYFRLVCKLLQQCAGYIADGQPPEDNLANTSLFVCLQNHNDTVFANLFGLKFSTPFGSFL